MPAFTDDVMRRLTTKVGPLPAWAWAAIPAGAYVAWSYYRVSTGQGDDLLEEELPLEDEFEIPGTPGLPGYPGVPDGSSNLPLPPIDEYTNQEWQQDAIKWLIANGVNALTATRAITSYLYGTPATLNAEEMNALGRVIAAKGPAPEGGTIPGRTPGTKPKPTPVPSKSAPKPPGAISLRIASGKLNATWNPSATPGSTYELERKINASPYRLIARTTRTGHLWESPAGTITVRVRATNKYGRSKYVTSGSVKLVKATFPKPKPPPRRRRRASA